MGNADVKAAVMEDDSDRGRRLLVNIVDRLASRERQRAWTSIPSDPDDLSKGYRDITYASYGRAIDQAAHWLDSVLGKLPCFGSFPLISYTGPRDLQYPIVCMAAVKTGRQTLLASPFASTEAQLHLFEAMKTTCLIYAAGMEGVVRELEAKRASTGGAPLHTILMPKMDNWDDLPSAKPYLYTRKWEDGKLDPFLTLHTSGSTGLPRPVTYNNKSMCMYDMMPVVKNSSGTVVQQSGQRFFGLAPPSHYTTIFFLLQFTVCGGTVLVTPPPGRPLDPETVASIIRYGKLDFMTAMPATLEAFASDPAKLELLSSLQKIMFTGASLNQSVGDIISERTLLHPGFGTTECGGFFARSRAGLSRADWAWMRFSPICGLAFEQRHGNTYEAVIYRNPEYERYQQVFHIYPDKQVFYTNDLFEPHPTHADLWRYVGRMDDLLVLASGHKFYASTLELLVQSVQGVKVALVGEQGRARTCLLVEVEAAPDSHKGRESLLDQLWPAVDKVNETKADTRGQLSRELTMLVDPKKPLVKTEKGNVARKPSLLLYKEEIEEMYRKAGDGIDKAAI